MNAMAPAPGLVNDGLRQRLTEGERAIYLPAVSKTFADFAHQGTFSNPLPVMPADLNFLDPASKLFHYPFALYSAGQSNTKAPIKPDMVSQRDRAETLVLGDSGGYQVSTKPGYFTGTINGKPKPIPAGQLPAIVMQNMRWMEAIADYSMVLDFPTGGIGSGKMAEHVTRLIKAGYDLKADNDANRLGMDYNACLVQTKLNNDEFLKHHVPGATAFLNVLQGRSEAESKFWYEAVKHYPFAGWAFAGHHQNRFSLLLARLIDMRDDGLLEKTQWVHVLGISSLPIGMLLTRLQKQVRRLYNPSFQISFDTASPFLMGANSQLYSGFTIDKQGWSIHSLAPTKLPASDDNLKIADLMAASVGKMKGNGRSRYVSQTKLSQVLKLGDLRKPDPDYPGEYKLTADGYNLLMSHNVEALIEAHDGAHAVAHGAYGDRDPLSIPLSLHYLGAFIDAVLDMPTSEAKVTIKEHRAKLDVLRDDV